MVDESKPSVNLINAQGISKAYDHRVLFENLTLGINKGEHIGVVGVNGGGKSTLIKVLTGEEIPDEGRISTNNSVTIGYLSQRDLADENLGVENFLFSGATKSEWERNPTNREIVSGLLGVDFQSYFEKNMKQLSGGESRRIHLAKLLIAKDPLLLLDEPTNHLDIDGIRWLAKYLRANPEITTLTITHDRWFLDETSDAIWEVVHGEVTRYEGGYSAFILSKAERAEREATLAKKRNALIKKELAWLRRGAPARTAKPKFRIEAANQLITKEPATRNDPELLAFAVNALGKNLLDLQDISYSIGEKKILHNVNWNIAPGSRIGIVGANGAGKSTLLSILAGQTLPTDGFIKRGQKVRTAYLSQQLAELNGDDRVIESVKEIANQITLANGGELSASQACEKLGFDTDGQWRKISDLSGGERRRLQLTRLLMSAPNFLLLDEPTNDFDIETLTSLEDLLDSFGGSLIVVSHDRYFLERVCNDFYLIKGDGNILHLPGGIEEYLSFAKAFTISPTIAQERKVSNAAQTRMLKKELAKLDNQIGKITLREDEVLKAINENTTNHGELLKLMAELESIKADKENLENQWLELTTEIDLLS